MTQIALGVAVGMINEAKGDCWFCKEKPKKSQLKNDEVADPDTKENESEDAVPENDEENDASELGKNIGKRPERMIECPDTGKDTKVLSAAHHCIPGNASFQNAESLLDFIRKDGPFNLESDIGYSINHENNGVWLPGNYNVRANKEHYKKNWGDHDEDFKEVYAIRAMKASKMQFHDAHKIYSEKVLKTLQTVADSIGEPEGECPFCDEAYETTRPPYGLVGRLDFISRQHKKMISSLSSKKSKKYKYVENGYFTSRMVKKYFNK